MKYDPINESIYTDNDVFIKKLSCPYKILWDDLEKVDSEKRKCSVCNHNIVDTERFTDNEVLAMVQQNPATCLKVNLDKVTIKPVTNEKD